MKILETHIVPAITKEIRLQEYAVSIFTPIQSRSGLKKAIKKAQILIDGKPANTGDWIRRGQKIQLLEEAHSQKKIFPLDIDVLWEDEHMAVVHKPAGYSTSGNYFKTIENTLPHNLEKSNQPDSLPFPLPTHRLDNPTAGILLCAKTTNALLKLQKGFAQKKIQKTYYALVHGDIEAEMKIDSAIDDKPAKTFVKPTENYKIEGEKYTLAAIQPLTGRTHQIRIHLNRNMTPIVGDKIYGNEGNGYFRNKNLFLFAAGISFRHPVNNELLEFRIDLPKRFRNLRQYRLY